jgi:hypothetical protein
LTTLLGILGLAVFVVAVISFAAGITWIVLRVSLAREREKPAESSSS